MLAALGTVVAGGLPAIAMPAPRASMAPTAADDGLRCLGASTMQPLLAAWARAFHAHRPQASVEIGDNSHYSAEGVAAALAGQVNCISFAREPFPAELVAFKRRLGQTPIVIPVAGGSYATPHGTFALAIYVNRANPLRGLMLPQLAALFSGAPAPGGQRPLATWGQLGLRGVWAARPIHLYGMTPRRASGNPPGIVNFLDRRVLGVRSWRSDLRVQVDTPGASALAAIVRGVGADPDGIGYSGFGYAGGAVRALPLAMAPGAPFRAGTPAEVAAGRYALARTIYLGFPRSSTGGLSPAACRFLSFVLGTEGQRLIAQDRMHFDPLTPAQDRAAHATLAREGLCDASQPTADTQPPHPRPAYIDENGAVRIVGYNDMRWMLEAVNQQFALAHPGIRFVLLLKGTRTAPPALADGSSLFAPMGAEFSGQELAQYQRRVGAAPLEFRVAHAALDPRARSSPLAIFVNRANPLSTIGMDQLRRSFTDAPSITQWSQLGLAGAWALRRIHPCGLAPDTALGRFMRRHHFAGRPYASGYREFRESSAVLEHVAADPDALCFADLNQAGAAVRVVGIRLDKGRGISTGSRADIVSGHYPLDRFLYIYIRAPDARGGHPLLCEYLRLLLSDEGQRIVASARPGYLPLSAAERTAERHRLEESQCRFGIKAEDHDDPAGNDVGSDPGSLGTSPRS
jgi:ABC-type phosphate transport system, periplasmic component